nr:hypothetical protein [Tanacetum cinerariifolium]
AVTQLAGAGSNGQGRHLFLQTWPDALEPLHIKGLVAGDPEHLLIQRRAQTHGRVDQLLLVELQGDGFIEQRTEFAVQALQQIAAGHSQVKQGFAQLRSDVRWLLGSQQLFNVGNRAAHRFTLLIDLELIQADVGDFVRQAFVQLQMWQRLLLFIENLGQQQAAA